MIAEMGADISRFPSAGHLAAWAGLAPGNRESAGKRKRAPTRHGNVWLKGGLGVAALAIGRTKGTYLAAQYHRLRPRRGEKRTIVAVAHSMLVSAYHMLTTDVPYQDLGPDHFTRRLGVKNATADVTSPNSTPSATTSLWNDDRPPEGDFQESLPGPRSSRGGFLAYLGHTPVRGDRAGPGSGPVRGGRLSPAPARTWPSSRYCRPRWTRPCS
ncbi:transposase [Streptomyces sp. NEAU-174]|uniref:transposase n=1 Tax=Streptomyces sp. NEAU-174 TaxID=3458254 RepID=UPI0040447E63